MIVAVVSVRVVQMTGDEIVRVIPVRDCLMAAALTMLVIGRVAAAVAPSRAVVGILVADRDYVLVHMTLVRVVQVAVMQVVDVAVVPDSRVSAVGAVLVRVTGMGPVFFHVVSFGSMMCGSQRRSTWCESQRIEAENRYPYPSVQSPQLPRRTSSWSSTRRSKEEASSAIARSTRSSSNGRTLPQSVQT